MSFELTDQVERRLTGDRIAWLTTVSPTGRPSPRPVWFLWTGEYCVIYSQPDAAKLKHIRANNQVSLHFDADRHGGDIVVVSGCAEPLPDAPPADRWPGLLEKYTDLLATLGMSPEHFVGTYSAALRVVPERVWTIPA